MIFLNFLFSYQGHIGAYLVLGGVDSSGPHLFTVHAHGSTDKLPYVTMGKGNIIIIIIIIIIYYRVWFIGCHGRL